MEGYVNLTIKDFLLYHNYTPNRNKNRINSKVYDTLNLMIKMEFIQYIGCYANGGLASLEDVDCDMMFTVKTINYDTKWDPDGNFIKILFSEIDKLRQNNVKFMGKALNIYINIKRFISCDSENISASHVAYPSENYLSRQCNCGVNSIKKYIKILCDIGMLYMKNYGSYLRLYRGKEIVVNSNNVYALEEKYLNDDAREELKARLESDYGYLDGFFPFCNNLPYKNEQDEDMTAIDSASGEDIHQPDNDNWDESDSFEDSTINDFSIEEIINMPSASDLELEEKQKVKQNTEKPKDDKNTSYEVPTRVIHMKKKSQKREIPIDVKIQDYADDLYEQHGYGTEYEMSIFIAELSEKFPGLDDYGKYYNRAKKYHEMGV